MASIHVARGIFLAVLAVLSGCSPGGSLICSDYRSTRGCDGGKYSALPASGRVITRHEGIDFKASPGTDVISATYGTIHAITGSFCGGIALVETDIIVKHEGYNPLPLFARYAHIEPSLNLRRKMPVRPGDLLGTVQDPNTIAGKGRCVGRVPHVHFALHLFPRAEQLHYDPHEYWADGPGKVTCHDAGKPVPKGKIVAPLRC